MALELVVQDVFTDTNGTALGSHTPTPTAAGGSWTLRTTAGCTITSNAAVCDSGSPNGARYEYALDIANDHSVEVAMSGTSTAVTVFARATHVSGSPGIGVTGYSFFYNSGDANVYIRRILAGVSSNKANSAYTRNNGDVLRITVTGQGTGIVVTGHVLRGGSVIHTLTWNDTDGSGINSGRAMFAVTTTGHSADDFKIYAEPVGRFTASWTNDEDFSALMAGTEKFTTAVSSRLDGLLTGASVGGFVVLHDPASPTVNKLSDVLASGSQLVSAGDNGPGSIFSAWPSFAFDERRGATWHYGGGHSNYYGNDTYQWNINTDTWSRASLPTQIVGVDPLGGQEQVESVDGVEGSPVSSHTGDGNWYSYRFDRFFTFGGSNQHSSKNYRLADADRLGDGASYPSTYTGPYTFDPNRADGSKTGGDPGTAPSAADTYVVNYDAWSSTSWTPAVESKTFDCDLRSDATGLASKSVKVYEVADPTNYALGSVTATSFVASTTNTVTVNVASVSGSGAAASRWRIVVNADPMSVVNGAIGGSNAWELRHSIDDYVIANRSEFANSDYQGGTHFEIIDGVQRAFRIPNDGGNLYRVDFPDLNDPTQDVTTKVGTGGGYSGQGCLAYAPDRGVNGGGLAVKTAGTAPGYVVWWALNPIGGAAVSATVVTYTNIDDGVDTLALPAYWSVVYDAPRDRFLLFIPKSDAQAGTTDGVGTCEVWELVPPAALDASGSGTYGTATKLAVATSSPNNPGVTDDMASSGRWAGLLGRARYIDGLDIYLLTLDHGASGAGTGGKMWGYIPDPWQRSYTVEGGGGGGGVSGHYHVVSSGPRVGRMGAR